MYTSVKSCISYNNHTAGYFNCEIGVRQGENLFPFLFSLFLNDLEEFLLTKDILGLKSITDELDLTLVYILNIILYILPFMLLSNNL
jgi:hypothetical protein